MSSYKAYVRVDLLQWRCKPSDFRRGTESQRSPLGTWNPQPIEFEPRAIARETPEEVRRVAHQFSTIDNYVISFFFFVFVLFQSCVEGICSVCSGVVRRVDVPNWYVRLRLLFIVVVVVVVEQNKPRFAGETVAKEPINNPCLLTIVGCFFSLQNWCTNRNTNEWNRFLFGASKDVPLLLRLNNLGAFRSSLFVFLLPASK